MTMVVGLALVGIVAVLFVIGEALEDMRQKERDRYLHDD